MKTKIFLSTIFVLLFFTGCDSYKRVSLSGSDFYGRNKVIKNIDRYDIYVHQADSVYELVDPKALDSARITGQIQTLKSKDRVKKANVDTTGALRPGEEDDIHIYLDNAAEVTDVRLSDQITLEAKNVETVSLTGKENQGTLGGAGISILAIFLVVLLIVAVIVGGAILIAFASAESVSDSGCYVATMVYGSYDAPEVMTLRRFRDQFLQKYIWGRAFIQWYYRHSPGFVARHQSKKWLHVVMRGGLNVLVFILKPFFK
ncbi:MAG: hypothetical protein GQ574_06545 [Crocinitomix sp.]|nr:hypothetical protein [Crocinitomix sp.]